MGCLIFDQYGIAPEFKMLHAAKSTRNAVTEFCDNEPSEPVAENPVCKVAPELSLLVREGLQVSGIADFQRRGWTRQQFASPVCV